MNKPNWLTCWFKSVFHKAVSKTAHFEGNYHTCLSCAAVTLSQTKINVFTHILCITQMSQTSLVCSYKIRQYPLLITKLRENKNLSLFARNYFSKSTKKGDLLIFQQQRVLFFFFSPTCPLQLPQYLCTCSHLPLELLLRLFE